MHSFRFVRVCAFGFDSPLFRYRRTNGCVTMLFSVQNLVSLQAFMCYLVFFVYTFLLLFTMHWIVSCFRLVVDLALFIFIRMTVVFDLDLVQTVS